MKKNLAMMEIKKMVMDAAALVRLKQVTNAKGNLACVRQYVEMEESFLLKSVMIKMLEDAIRIAQDQTKDLNAMVDLSTHLRFALRTQFNLFQQLDKQLTNLLQLYQLYPLLTPCLAWELK